MDEADLKTPCEWMALLYPDMIVLDPDGWDRRGDFDADWRNPITEAEFKEKFAVSTVGPKGSGWGDPLCG